MQHNHVFSRNTTNTFVLPTPYETLQIPVRPGVYTTKNSGAKSKVICYSYVRLFMTCACNGTINNASSIAASEPINVLTETKTGACSQSGYSEHRWDMHARTHTAQARTHTRTLDLSLTSLSLSLSTPLLCTQMQPILQLYLHWKPIPILYINYKRYCWQNYYVRRKSTHPKNLQSCNPTPHKLYVVRSCASM